MSALFHSRKNDVMWAWNRLRRVDFDLPLIPSEGQQLIPNVLLQHYFTPTLEISRQFCLLVLPGWKRAGSKLLLALAYSTPTFRNYFWNGKVLTSACSTSSGFILSMVPQISVEFESVSNALPPKPAFMRLQTTSWTWFT